MQAQDFQDPEVHHRHVSHLFGLYPGHTMSVEKTPDLCKAVANSLYKRGTFLLQSFQYCLSDFLLSFLMLFR